MTFEAYKYFQTKRSPRVKEESNEQMLFIDWLRTNYPWVITIISPIVKYTGSKWSRAKQGARIKALGYIAGTLDIFIPVPLNGFHGLFIEMKRKDGGSIQENQRDMSNKLTLTGYKVVFCKGFEEAKAEFLKYIK